MKDVIMNSMDPKPVISRTAMPTLILCADK